MNIYYFIRIIMQNGIRYFQEEACQYNKVNMILVQYFQCFPSAKSWAVRISDGTLSLSARLSTPACALLTITNATSAVLFSKKYRIILSAFVPSPEAKIAIFFMMFSILVHIKQKCAKFCIYLPEYLLSPRNIYSFATAKKIK